MEDNDDISLGNCNNLHEIKEEKRWCLQSLGKLFIQFNHTVSICTLCKAVILDIIERAKEDVEKAEGSERQKKYLQFCIALSQAGTLCPDTHGFTVEYLKKNRSFLFVDKQIQHDDKFVVQLAKAAWQFVCFLGDQITNIIQLEDVLNFLLQNEGNENVVWFCVNTMAEMLHMTSSQRDRLLQTFISDQESITKLKLRNAESFVQNDTNSQKSSSIGKFTPEKIATLLQSIVDTDLHREVVMVAGIILPKITVTEEILTTSSLVPVPSMMNNLRSLALAISSSSPVLLQGPVGCGKTSLVEHVAAQTGRHKSPHIIKIQLGDQTDSKALLGTYRCTDVPGEFVWQPGILTQAVREGHWILLEDIDYAPMDVVSVLLPLLERNMLSVPGHGDNIQAVPGFRLFATQRLLGSTTGWHRQQSSSSVLLEKMWTKINVEPLSRSELEQVIHTTFPKLSTVTDKLLDIYFMLSAGKHELYTEAVTDDAGTVGKFLSHDGRLISTRDLMNWCSRIATDFDVTSTATANLVLQEALDCFVSCLPNPPRRVLVAEAIGAKLNITKVKAEYYCVKYKPTVEVSTTSLTVGRVRLEKLDQDFTLMKRQRSTFSFTRQSSALLERVAMCVTKNEPILLVGETGTGKTSSVQYLAEQIGHTLKVINMNQQSDSADLLGGFKPLDMRHVVKPFREKFEVLFCETFSRTENIKFLSHLQECFTKRKWKALFTLMEHTIIPAVKRGEQGKISADLHKRWINVRRKLQQLKVQVQQSENVLSFSFIEGTLVKALRKGHWVLLDEINLAAAETLECLSGLLESQAGSIVLTERGDIEPIVRHENFRLFACMNPATDVGKKDLPVGIRNRFTELFVDELEDPQDLKILVSDYLRGLSLTVSQVDGVVNFYLRVKRAAEEKLTDGTGHKPHFSLRTLCRALRYASTNPCGQVSRSLYEGFCLSFLTQLDRSSHPTVELLICQCIIGKANIKSLLKQPLPIPLDGKYLNFEGYWISVGKSKPQVPENYILTSSVRANLRDLARVVSAGQHPVLLQGETSVGKTSLVTWLAQSSGNVCVRVNNHEHTDLQEYVGCYAADETGKLVFKEGVLVEAMRKGHWIILDELNLAPTDVLEALNRLLDDNRELFIPETQETVKAHPKFMLFATQNPPGQYGGRKMLSRAFRNRFIELHFDEIPCGELETILHKRCDLPLSYSKKLVAAMLDLQTRRRGSGVFAGKQGFMTLRDLFRWANRYKCQVSGNYKFYDWDQHMADHGFMLLAGRVRKPEEILIVQEVIRKHLKRFVDADLLFCLTSKTSSTTMHLLKKVMSQSPSGFEHIVWTYGMRRLAVLIGQAIQFNEPILLVGETGCGKTTMCQLYSSLNNNPLHSINCHLHTESADFLGGLRPCRSHEQGETQKERKFFEWTDGPLVEAMKEGSMFLIDEISLADDSVLERLNSVLEPERTLLLAEKGGGDGSQNEVEEVKAKDGFQVFATMNPGGDFGKKELSPALRNRFTEIWCPQSNVRQDLINIIEHNLKSGIHLCNQEDGTSGVGRAIMDFVEWFSNNDIGKRCTVSIRDILSWVTFINTCSKTLTEDAMETDSDNCGYNLLDPAVALIHGACLVFLDGIGAGTTSRGKDAEVEYTRNMSVKYLVQLVSHVTHQSYDLSSIGLLDKNDKSLIDVVRITEESFCIWPFSIPKGVSSSPSSDSRYALQAPTTCVNAQRIVRALQLPRPLLLEGSPGVGKTSLVSAIAKAAGCELVRINLSEQTDVTDLFGADLPVEGAEGGVFAWRDGPLLKALKMGHWVVLDELNLASQSVLEGLNACLDHRAEIYIPELGKSFQVQHEKTRLFACQNPLNQGGGRKGLPRSFLNRFTQVYVEPLTFSDLLFIAKTMYPTIPTELLTNMVRFNMQIYQEAVLDGQFGQKGGPWEFNLRDLFRWCDLLLSNQRETGLNPGEYVSLLYRDRMRTLQDKQKVMELYSQVFQVDSGPYSSSRISCITENWLQVGHSFVKREKSSVTRVTTKSPLYLLHHCLEPLESVMKCVEMNWMSILVGPQSCGKTSLIQVLSHLTGHRLHVLAMNSAMDTTELLGGFEQADTGRHLEEIAADLEDLVVKIEVKLLLQKSTSEVMELLRMISYYKKMNRQGEKLSSIEELQLLRDKCSGLLQVHKCCKKLLSADTDSELSKALSHIESQLVKLDIKLRVAKPGSGGGTFEWVDSLLVQALQSGDWLLIDNVNFCSPSVLDRLNALLEPNGELSINERGVIDGQIPTVKPHPNFRLFLTMDPKFGEISRAMRNRGVEIYIPGEDEGNPYSDHDVKLMLQGIGLTNVYVCDWLMAMHEDMRCNLGMGERSNILDLLHASLVTMQQIDRGIPLADALKHATLDVYVKSVKNITTNEIAVEIWHKNHEKLRAVSDVKVVEQEGNYQGALTSWCRDTTLTNVNQHGAPVQRIYSEIIKGDNWDGDNIQQKLRQLKFAGVLFLNLSAAHDLYIHADWLKHMCEKIDKEIRKNSNRVQRRKQQKQLSELRHMSENTFTGVSGLLPELQEIVKMTSSNADTDLLLECPVDGRWNQQCFEMTLSQLDSQHRTQCEGHLEVFYNRFHLIQSVIRDLCSADTQLSILKTFLEGTDVRLLSHAVFTDLHCLFQQREDLINCLTQLDLSDFHHVTEVLEGFKWWTRLLEVVVDGTRSDDIHRITLYWTWLKNKFLPIISHSVPPSFQSMITQIQRTLGQDNYKAKMFTKFWKSLGHPMPYQCESEAHLTFALHDLWKLIDVKADPGDMIVNTRVRMVCKEGQTINRTLMACYDALIQQTDSSTVERVNIMMETIQRSLAIYGIQRKNIAELMSMETDQSEQTSNHDERTGSQSSQHVELWPLLEYTQSLATLHLVNKMLTSISSPDKAESLRQSMEAITTFSLYYTPVCPRQLSHLVQTSASDNKEKRKELLQQILKDVYQEIWKITTGKSIDKWLNWNERDTSEETIATGNDVTMGPACFHKAVVSYCGFSYMCHQQNRPGKTYGACLTDSQHMQVPLGQFQYHLEKLRHVTSNTWIHAAVMGSQNFHRGHLERQHLFLLFLQFLDAVKVLLDKEASDVVKELKNQLHNGSHSSQIVTTLVDQCCNYLKSLVDHQSEDILIKCMTHLKCLLSQKDMELWDLGACWVYLGLVCMQLLNPCVPVDPVEKVAVKLQHLRQEAEDIECELEVRCTYHHNLTGSDLLALPDCLLHPHITYLLKKRVLLQEQILLLESQQAHRPAKSQFSNLVSDIHNFMGSVGSVNHIPGLLNKLLRALDPKVTGNELAEEKMWQKIQTSFVEGLETKYPHYKDITVPFIVCVQQVMHGMRLVATCVDRSREMDVLNSKLTTTEFNKKEDIISKQLIAMSRFPSVCRNYPNSLDLVKSLMSEHSFKIVKVIADTTEEEEGQYVTRELISRLRYSMLIHIRNEGFVRKELTDDFTYTLSMLLHQFVLSWQQQQERKRKKEAENSLYKYKSQVHGDEREHDEIEESEFREQFPTFEKEFQDVIGSQSLDDDSTIEEKATFEMDPEDVDGSLTEDEMVTVCQTHQALFTTLTKTDWLRQSHMTEVKDKDIIDPALSSYTVAASLGKLCFKVLSKELDNEVNGGHLLASHVLQEQITPSSPTSSQSIQLNKYDIYHDPNVAEVVKCPAVLQRLSKRIQELLLEWPDHPTLRQLTQIIDRILSFPITSPVVKFLTGLELLLEKAQDWESNAAKYVSMATELGEISSLILEWRKMELSCWSQCLDVVLQKQTQKASRWWFYLYQLISAQEESEENHSAILKTLKEFMEKSTLGEYEARLNMLMSFHCQLAYMPKSKKNDDLLNLLWNLYQFYKQFTTVVTDNIQKLRTPIERELKGFVKIARWTDMNYWALKQTTEKTHRTLHKHMKAFQSALEQPVQGILSESDQRLNSVNDGDEEVQREQLYSTVQDVVHKQTLIQQGAQQIPVLEGLHLPLQTRLDSLCQRLGKHWKSVTSRSKYGGLASSLDEFTGEVIETVHQLQALEVSQHEDKEKRKSEAKHIGQKKRKALSDLFKYLILIGLSHRKGLLLVSDESENTPLMVAPLDMSVLLLHTLGHKERNHELMCDVWGSCQKYYYKCIARKARFSSALQSPSQELGVGNIERCKGFMEHLSKLATDQYSELATISQLYKLAGSSLEILHQLSMEKKPLPPQSQVKEWLKTIKEILVSAKEGLSQFEVFLHCCPKAGAELKIHPSPFPKEYLSQMALCFHGDELWSDCLGIIKNLYKTSNDLYNQMLTLSKKNIFVWDDLCCMQQTFKQLEGFIGDIATMGKSFSDPSDSSSPSLVSCLTYIREEINTQSQEYDKWINKVKLSWTNSETLSDELKSCLDGSKVVEEFAGKVEEFVASVLLVVQTLTKCYESQDEGDRTSEDDDTDLQDGHLVSLLSNKIKEDYSCLQLIKITESLSSLIQELVLISEWENYPLPVSAICTQIFSRCGPLVQQYVSIVEYYLLHLLVINKTTTKLLSVLLAVFTELASKGFCTPEEFAEETAGEGATDFEDIEGGGMGEGEGMKNVSDQIENEDQLDEAQKPGEKKEEDISQQPDIASEENAIEMSDDLEGKLHDLEAADQEEKSDDDNDEGNDEIDKQMGEVDEKDADKLDEQMWGEDDEETNQNEDTTEESGPGAQEESKKELVAKDDNQGKSEEDDKSKKEDKEDQADNNDEEKKPHELEQFDESEYDDDRVDPNRQQTEPQEQPEPMDLPDDLHLDEMENDMEEDATAGQDEAEDSKPADGDTAEEDKGDDKDKDDEVDTVEEENEDDNIKESGDKDDEEKKLKEDDITEERKSDEDENMDDPGFTGQDKADEDERDTETNEKSEDQKAETYGSTVHDSQNAEQSETAEDQAGTTDNNQDESEGTGTSYSENLEGHQGQSSSKVAHGTNKEAQRKPLKRKPGISSSERSLGSVDQKFKKLKTCDEQTTDDSQNDAGPNEMEADLYEHIKDAKSRFDTQTLDVATAEQQAQQPVPNKDMEETDNTKDQEDVEMREEEPDQDLANVPEKLSSKLKKNEKQNLGDKRDGDEDLTADDGVKQEVDGDFVQTMGVARRPESTIHTTVQNLYLDSKDVQFDLETLRSELEEQLSVISHVDNTSPEAEAAAAETWHRYESLTSSLSQELCEQLRLVLEPSQATKLKGDYRTGKRLNMRKVIPYIASQFRKDKIWLRRTKPSKRQYQIMLAIDDSSSMVDNHSKQLAFESLAMISNALTLLESGELAICSFGESVKLLHPFTDQFTNQSGSKLLQHFTFEQKKTKVAQLLKTATAHMLEARSRHHGVVNNSETAQLLLIVSDGRGLFIEGMETVKSAVRLSRQANVFVVFVIIDNPQNKDSILDIKVPVFKAAGQMPEIKSYMDHFPFPFYIILRDINSLPHILSDALRQWFELVTSVDR